MIVLKLYTGKGVAEEAFGNLEDLSGTFQDAISEALLGYLKSRYRLFGKHSSKRHWDKYGIETKEDYRAFLADFPFVFHLIKTESCSASGPYAEVENVQMPSPMAEDAARTKIAEAIAGVLQDAGYQNPFVVVKRFCHNKFQVVDDRFGAYSQADK